MFLVWFSTVFVLFLFGFAFCSRLFLCVLRFVFVLGLGGLGGICIVYVQGWVGGISNVLVETRFDQSAKLAFWWTIRLGGPIPPGIDESVGRQALHAPRAPGHPP